MMKCNHIWASFDEGDNVAIKCQKCGAYKEIEPIKGKAYYIEDRINDIENKIEKFEKDIEELQKKFNG